MTKDIKVCKCLAILLNDTTKCHNIILDIDKLVQAMTFELDLNDFSSPKTMPINNIIIIDIVVDNVNYLD